MKTMGNTNEIKDPNKIAKPISNTIIPKYIGCRLMRKGPEVSSSVGFSYGFTVVFFCLNNELDHMFRTIPNKTNNPPK